MFSGILKYCLTGNSVYRHSSAISQGVALSWSTGYIFNVMLVLCIVTLVDAVRRSVTEPIRGLLLGETNLWVSCGWGGLVRFISCHCCLMHHFLSCLFFFFSRDCGGAARNMKWCQLSCYSKWLLPITPRVSANFRRTAVNKRRCVANTTIVTRISPYMPLLFQLVAPIRHPQAMRGLKRTKWYIFLGGFLRNRFRSADKR